MEGVCVQNEGVGAAGELRQLAGAIMETAHEPMALLGEDLRVIAASAACEHLLGAGDGGAAWKLPELRALLKALPDQREGIQNYSIEMELPNLGRRELRINARCLTLKAAGGEKGYLLSFEDATDRKERDHLAATAAEAQFLRQVIEALPLPVYTTDAQGRLTMFNRAAAQMAGRTPQLGTDRWCVSWKIYRPDGTPLPHGQCPMAVAIKENRALAGVEAVAEQPDGTRRIGLTYPTPLRDGQGRLVSAVNVVVDITDRKRTETEAMTMRLRADEQVRENQRLREQYEAMFSASMDFVYLFDRQGRFLSANQALLDLWGLTLEQAIGKTFLELPYEPKLAAKLQSQVEEVFVTARRIVDETEYTSPAGEVGYYQYIFAPVMADGRVKWVAGSTRVLTERRRVELLQAGQNEVLEQLAQGAPLEVVLTSLVRFIEARSPNLLASVLVRRPGEDHFCMAVAPSLSKQYIEAMARAPVAPPYHGPCGMAAHLGRPVYTNVAGDGRWTQAWRDLLPGMQSCISSPIRVGDQIVGAFGLYTPASADRVLAEPGIPEIATHLAGLAIQRKQAEEALVAAKEAAESANRAKEHFIAALSHELRTPLNAMAGWLEILRPDVEGKVDLEELREGLEVIERNLWAESQLVNDLLDVSRIASGKLRVEPGACDLSAVVGAALETILPAAAEKHIHLERIDAAALAPVSADPARIRQVVWNLLSNAVKYTPEGGLIRVSVHQDENESRIEVSDTGPGLPEGVDLFEAFTQGEASGGGLGLGLSIVRRILELHGGSIEARNGESGGAVLTARLPSNLAAVD